MLVMKEVVASLSDLLADSVVNDEMNVDEIDKISCGIVCAVDYLHRQVGIIYDYTSVQTLYQGISIDCQNCWIQQHLANVLSHMKLTCIN